MPYLSQIAEYLTAIIEDGNSALLAAALGDIASAWHDRHSQISRTYTRSTL